MSESSLRVLKFIIGSFISFMLFIFLIIPIFLVLTDDGVDEVKADGFTIEKYDVLLDVKEDNKIDVTESITINFTSEYKHGIFKFTPLWSKYTPKNGKTIKRKAVLSNYRSIGDPFSLDVVKKKERIKIGDPYQYVGLGEKDYTIKYTYDMGEDPFNNFDELIFHAFGDYWGTEIKNASIHVNMPKSIEGYNVNFFTDKCRNEKVNDVVDYVVQDNQLIANFNSEKYYQKQLDLYCSEAYHQNSDGSCDELNFDLAYDPLESSLTVDIELPEGYFVGGSWNYGYRSFLVSLIIFFLTGFTIYKWIKYGKDYEKKAQTVEFYPPDNLNAAEIGYIYNKQQANKKHTIGLIVQLASKGYLKIDEVNKNIQITNLGMIKPKKPSETDKKVYEREIEVRKLKDADDNLSLAENTVMVHLFKEGDTKVLKANIDKFLEVRDKLVNEGYIEIVRDNEKEIRDKALLEEQKYNVAMDKYRADMEKYEEIYGDLPELSSMEKSVYDRLFSNGDQFILKEHKTLYKAFDDVEKDLRNNLNNKIQDVNSSKQIFGSIVRIILIVILNIVSYSMFEDLDPRFGILYSLSFICIFISIFFTIFMKRKTEYGELIIARIKGFRNFLNTCEKSKLEALVSENPSYFYDILPYTYVLNISKKWIKKFEDIKMPEHDMGNFNYGNSYSYYSFCDSISYPSYSSSGSSSGCSSCGGGCSSCGGGCSSCGGGGSW